MPYVSIVILRQNIGRDFGSWKVGFDSAGDLFGFQKVVLADHSAYGP